MRWKFFIGLALTLAAMAGCKRQCFLTECDYKHYTQDLNLPPNLESPEVTAVANGLQSPRPATVGDPNLPIRYLTLNEAIATAIEHGRTGIQNDRLLGIFEDTLPSFQGINVALVESQSDSIRVLALEPAVTGSNIESSLSKFDAQWNTSMTWQRTNQPLGGNFLDNFTNGDNAVFSSALLKPLPSGGVAGITFNTAYTLLSQPPAGVTNPAYRPLLQFQFEQPLLQGFGVEINQLRPAHPGSVLTPFPTATRANEGILITRLQFDVQRAAFETSLNYVVLNVEIAYWNLYGAYWTLFAREQALRQAYEAWNLNRVRYEAGQVSEQDLAQTRQQYELFRGQRLQAIEQILENERQLRGLMGLPAADGTRLVPVDIPTLAPYKPDWSSALNDTLNRRPELQQFRQLVKFRQLDLIRQKDLLMPDLRFTSTYDVNGLGTHLDGGVGDPNNAFHSLATDEFHDWSLGLRLNVPIGFRDAHSGVRQARLRLSQSYLVLRDQEDRAQSFLAQQYQLLDSSYAQIQSLRALRQATAVQLQARFEEYRAGRIILDVLQLAQQAWSQAVSDEFNAVVQYNNTLARFEFAKGTLLQHDNVVIAENGLPQCAQVRAVEHERQRARALVLRERAQPLAAPVCGWPGAVPALPVSSAPSLAAVLEGQPPLPDATPSTTTGASDSKEIHKVASKTPAAPPAAAVLEEQPPPDATPSTTTGASDSKEIHRVAWENPVAPPAAAPAVERKTPTAVARPVGAGTVGEGFLLLVLPKEPDFVSAEGPIVPGPAGSTVEAGRPAATEGTPPVPGPADPIGQPSAVAFPVATLPTPEAPRPPEPTRVFQTAGRQKTGPSIPGLLTSHTTEAPRVPQATAGPRRTSLAEPGTRSASLFLLKTFFVILFFTSHWWTAFLLKHWRSICTLAFLRRGR